ncbi:MAG: hypothetical protein E2O68_00535 [Deltaproteobacteria bacterium]|nr:MAG: hypothetical protein E2O68_00535 [Deltaproteobacteria bacterium]
MKFFITLLILISFNAKASNLAKCQFYLLVDIIKMYPVQLEIPGMEESKLKKPSFRNKKSTYFSLTRGVYKDIPDALTGATVNERASAGAKLAFAPIILPLTITIDAIFIAPFQIIRDLINLKQSKEYKKAIKKYGKKYEQEYNLALNRIQKAYAKIKGSKWKLALLKKKMEVLQLFTTVNRISKLTTYRYNNEWLDDFYLNWLLKKMKENKLVSDKVQKDPDVMEAILKDLTKTLHEGKCQSFPTIEKYFAAYRAI